jgi:DnaJ-class molecular chaperone
MRATIYPLEKCPKCKGTGRNEQATRELRAKGELPSGYVRCTLCNGKGEY